MQEDSHRRSATFKRLVRLQANHMIEQSFEFVAEGDKYGALARLLEREMDGSRLLIFCETKRGCDGVTRQLRTEGWPALSIHGDKSQQERDWVLAVSVLPYHLQLPTCLFRRSVLALLWIVPLYAYEVVSLQGVRTRFFRECQCSLNRETFLQIIEYQ